MKKILLLAIMIPMIACCSKDQMEPANICDTEISESEKEDALREFSAVLSRAVSSDRDLRCFIKETAMKQFDMDYDVFYPYVKNQIVSGDDKTFRDILLQYSEDPARFEEIEKELPLLTILVPDWSFVGCFSILEWNPESPEIAVGYETRSENKPILAGGELVGQLTDGAIPGFPTLIVKNSDRMRQISPATKSGEGEYEFIDNAFNAALHPQTRVSHQYSDVTIDGTPDVSNFMPEDDVAKILKDAYDKLKGDPYAVQRDYIYFGITPEQPIGRENTHIKEYIHKFKFINFNANGSLGESDDFISKDHRWEYKENNSAKSAQQLRDHFYSDGNIELKFTIIIPYKDGSVYQTTKVVNANFGDVFAIDHASLDYRHKTWFCKDWYVYTIEDSSIKPRWFTVDIDLPLWHLASESDIISIYVEEIDPSRAEKRTITVKYSESETNEVSGGVDVGVGTDISASGNIAVDHSHTSANERMEETVVETTTGSDELGTIELNFMDPVVTGQSTKNGKSGYLINTVTSGTVTMMIMPKEI